MKVSLNQFKIAKEIFKVAYPDYKGRKFNIVFDRERMSVRSYWDEGSRTVYCMVRLSDMTVAHAPNMAHPFFTTVQGVDDVKIPEGFVIVSNAVHWGVKAGLTIFSSDSEPKFISA